MAEERVVQLARAHVGRGSGRMKEHMFGSQLKKAAAISKHIAVHLKFPRVRVIEARGPTPFLLKWRHAFPHDACHKDYLKIAKDYIYAYIVHVAARI